MKKLLWLFLLCPVLSFAQASPVVPNWCAQQQNGLSQTAWQVFSLPNLSCIQLNPAWSTIDTGTTAPNFVWANYDPTGLTPYTGWSLGACTTNGTTSTCNILSGTWTIIQNATIIISGSAGCDGTYTAGTNGSTFVHITSGCTSASGGKLLIACGANLAQGAAPCKLVIMSAMTDAAGVQNNAAYPFSQAYANSSCPAWQTGVTYGFNSCVTHGGHFQHVVNIPALTAQCTDISFGSFCLWNDDGATNAFVQEAVVGPSFQGNANAPNVFVSGGAVFSVTSNNCQPSESSACLATDVATGFPVYWETPMQAALKTWCTGVDGSSNLGFLQHYNSVVPAGQLLALECGAPQGVEWFFAMEGFFEAKYSMNLSQTESLLVNYASNNLWSSIHTEWVALGSPSWGMLVPDGIYSGCATDALCSLYSDILASVSLQYAENSPGNYGVRTANIATYLSTGVVRGDWVGIFARYPNTKFHVLEPFSVSCPNVTSGPYNPSLCNPGTQGVTGDYRTILPFATQFISTGTAQPIFILFEDDVACTYEAGITITVSGGSYPPCVNAPYTLPMANAAAGIFANTTITTGVTGSFTISGPTPTQTYSARTDLLPQPYPLTIPCPAPSCTGGGTFSGAGFQLNPSDFPATQLVKITDDSTPATNHAGFTTNCDDSSEGNDFNTLTNRFVLCQHGNIQNVWSFNPATLQFAQIIGPLWSLANSFTGGHSFYSYTQPYTLYHSHPCQAGITGCAQHDLTIFQADTSGIGNPPTPTVVVDLNTACGLPNYAGPAFEDGVTVSRDDQSFSFNVCNSGSCGQGSAGNFITGVWNRTNGCSYLNTSTWQVFNNGVLLGTAGGTPQNFVMHNARITQDGSLLRINKGTCTSCVSGQNWLLWTPFTTTIAANTDLNGCGHLVNGYSHIANKCQGPINLNGLGYYPFSSINTWTSLPAAYPASSDANEAHPNWSNDNPTDTNPFFVSFDWPGSFAANFAWDSELVGVSTDGSGKVYRFAHNYATPTPSAFVPVNTSQDGKFLLLSTDWNQMLGCTNGSTLGCGPSQPNWQASHSYASGALVTPLTGNPGGFSYRTIGGTSGSVQPSPWNQMLGNVSIDGLLTWTNVGSYRSDVFLVELNPSPAATTALAQPNNDDSATGWQPACVGPTCAGGVGTPSSWNQTFVNASPSQDGNSMMMTETGTNYSNVMFHKSIGADNSATTFTGTYSVYIPSLTPYQVFGMDMYQYIPGVRLMFGSQCAVAGTTAGFWSFFDQGSGPDGTWHVSTVPCPLTSATWYTISMTVHRVPGDTSCAGGVPAEHYDSLTQATVPLAPVTYPLNVTYCSETTAFANDTGMQFDISSNSVGGTLTAYVDLMSYTAKY